MGALFSVRARFDSNILRNLLFLVIFKQEIVIITIIKTK